MAVGKQQKKPGKGPKKGGKKKQVDPFLKKDWFDVKAPPMFSVRTCGKTLATRSQGTRLSSDSLKGRVLTMSLGDLNNDNDQAFRKFKLQIEDVQGKQCLTNFYGMDLTRDKLCSLVKKWQTTIEAHVDVTTSDGYALRVFVIGFTKRHPNQVKKHTYAQSTQVKRIREKMVEIVTRELKTCDLKEAVNKFIPDSIGKDITKACSAIFPLSDALVRKVKVLKKPKLDLGRLMEMYGDSGSAAVGSAGEGVVRPDDYEPPVQSSV